MGRHRRPDHAVAAASMVARELDAADLVKDAYVEA
jgi:hypothetical protein